MYTSFANKSTETWNKLVTEEYLKDIFVQYPQLKNTVAVVLVGHWSGLDRHLEMYKGFRTVWVCERDTKTFRGLERYANQKRYKNVRIVNADFFDVVKSLIKKNIKIGLLDFDGIETIGKNESKLSRLARKASIPIVVNIGSARGQSCSFKAWCKERNKRKTAEKNGFRRYDLKRIAPEYIAKHFKGYSNEFFTYLGLSPMYMQISLRKGLTCYAQI